jgi:hypothetical protein
MKAEVIAREKRMSVRGLCQWHRAQVTHIFLLDVSAATYIAR